MEKLDKFEEVRNKLQIIEEILNRMPLEHSKDIFAKTSEKMDDLLASITPDMEGETVARSAKAILKDCYTELKGQGSLTSEQKQLLQNIESLH